MGKTALLEYAIERAEGMTVVHAIGVPYAAELQFSGLLELMRPLLDQSHLEVAWHAGQYQALPEVYVQNSALEIAWTRVVTVTGTREGRVVAPFLTTGYEGFNIDDEDDWERAEDLAASGSASLPTVERPRVPRP